MGHARAFATVKERDWRGCPPLQRAEEMRATERGQDQLTNNEPAGGVDPLGEDFLSHSWP